MEINILFINCKDQHCQSDNVIESIMNIQSAHISLLILKDVEQTLLKFIWLITYSQ